MNNNTILVVIPVNEKHKQILEEAAPDNRFIYSSIQDASTEQILEADIILGNVPVSKIPASHKLKWIQLNSAGADAYVQIPGNPVTVTTANGAYGQCVSEHMFAMLLAMQKKLHLYRDSQANRSWDDHGTVTSITDSTVLIFGVGDIGCHFAKMAHALGAYVIGIKRSAGICPDYMDELHLMQDCRSLLPRADAVVSFLPSTSQTRGLFNKEMFELMKPNALFLNGGRGDAVITEDLCHALDHGHLAGAALEVTDPEPLPKNHPFWGYPNIFITPHISGYYHLPVTLDKVVNICAENLKRYHQNQPLKNIMDFQAGYCTGNKTI